MAKDKDKKFKVVVHYPAAAEPFHDHDADRAETVGHLKTRVLQAFGLTEGGTPDGNNVTYTLYHQKTALENLTVTLGEIAGEQAAPSRSAHCLRAHAGVPRNRARIDSITGSSSCWSMPLHIRQTLAPRQTALRGIHVCGLGPMTSAPASSVGRSEHRCLPCH